MNKLKITEKKAKRYLEKHGLMKYLQEVAKDQIKPDYIKLAELHKIAIKRKPFRVLEFGTGWSTIILAHASGKVFSVDASKHWIDVVKKLIPFKNVEFHYSEVEAGKFNGRMCHFYKILPDIVPDFIYLDGPSPLNVKGDINNLSWKNRSVMAADILLMEPTLKPKTLIVIDRRTLNVRFLRNNLQRNWTFKRHKYNAITLELKE